MSIYAFLFYILLFHVREYPATTYPIHLPLAVFSPSSYILFSSAYNNTDRRSWWEAVGTTHSFPSLLSIQCSKIRRPSWQWLACQGARTIDYCPTSWSRESFPFYTSLHRMLLVILHTDFLLSVYSTRHSSGLWLGYPSQATPHYIEDKEQWDSFTSAV